MERKQALVDVVTFSSEQSIDIKVLELVATGRGSMNAIIGDADQRFALFHQSIDWTRVVVATQNEVPVGFLAYKYNKKGPYAPSFRRFNEVFSVWTGWYRFLIFYLVEYFSTGNAFYVYGIKVQPNRRRQGIASRMLDHVESLANTTSLPYIELDVSDTNTAGLELYKKRGYRVVKSLDLSFLPTIFNFTKVHVMRKSLSKTPL
ncbi:GNAT family N-acetyltransferase [Nitrincola nitratireducens]|uniref:Putative acetyltransferase n=1 Tax=Nitrincola nitratireducens TaxID=1229521 RepID=W9UVD8_9GAMM|nr:N-acetyltransferase [Nitrincola nitratireducens]EXJ11049.1 putative acetyltransferase [Nitrincola nitratireducens]